MAGVTNAVLQERQQQQFMQTMILLSKIDDHLVMMNGHVRDAQISDAEQSLRIKVTEKRMEKVEAEQKEVQRQAWKIAIVIALLTGAGMAGAGQALSLVIP